MSQNKPKVIFLGTSSVGKASILSALSGNININHKPTLFMGIIKVNDNINGKSIDYLYCNTCGQDSVNAILPMYIRGSKVAVLVYSVTDRASFELIQHYMNIAKLNEKDLSFILVGNKIDLNERKIDYQEGCELADSLNLPFFETSAKDGTNISNLKKKILLTLLENELEPIDSVPMIPSSNRGCMCNK